ncbi:tyrosine-type recombinase/integrase [Bradyrhizobium paxllaeri]|uniref:tyrosine-type recombinase/integrase n=1 Tax=Bradyrhizobium paxllaeri TaxID=190148 RepID=UPI0008104ADF|nr:tyrosine-type recombinase/integrase [Bradyrhizobium paxllaeri]
MTDDASTSESKHVPWNKGKIVGAKPPLRSKHVWSIRTKLQVEGRIRDLALFNIAIDSKLRGCDVVALKVDEVAPSGYAADRASVRQKKTGSTRLLSGWLAGIGLDPHLFGTHSLRRTKATLIYRRTGNLRAVQLLLRHTKIESTVRYLGIEVDDALAIAEQVDV